MQSADFHIGDAAFENPGYAVKYPVRHGIVEDWDLMVSVCVCVCCVRVVVVVCIYMCGCHSLTHTMYAERFMEQAIFKYLRAVCVCMHVYTATHSPHTHTH